MNLPQKNTVRAWIKSFALRHMDKKLVVEIIEKTKESFQMNTTQRERNE
jgi:hypothetical protein